jgi:hypothetical protein
MAQQDFGVTVAPTQIDPVAFKLLTYKIGNQDLIPSATVTDPAVAKQLGYNALLTGPATTFVQDQANGNVDWNPVDKDRLSGKFFLSKNPNTTPFAQSNVLGFPQSLDAESWTVSLTNTYIVKPNLTWEQRVGFIRQAAAATMSQALTPQDIGMSLFGSTNFPAIQIFTADGALRNSFFIRPRNAFANNGAFQNRVEWSSGANWITGRHTVYFGVQMD